MNKKRVHHHLRVPAASAAAATARHGVLARHLEQIATVDSEYIYPGIICIIRGDWPLNLFHFYSGIILFQIIIEGIYL